MNLSDNEKYLRDLLGNGTENLDMEALWDAVEPRLEKKKKRRAIIFWFFGAGLLFSIFGLAFTFWYTREEVATNHTTTSAIEQHAENNTSEKHDLNTGPSGNENTIGNKNIPRENNTIGLSENQPKQKAKTLASSPSGQYDINFYNLNQGNIYDSDYASGINKTIIYSSSENNNKTIKDESDNGKQVGKDEIIDKQEKLINTATEEKEKDEKERIEKENEKNEKNKKTTKKKRKKRKKWQPYFYTSGSVAYPIRILSSLENNGNNSLLDIKKEYENALESYQVNMNVKFINKKTNLILNAGANYENITEHFKYKEETTEIEILSITESITVDALGNTIATEEGMVEITTIEKRNISIYNHYRFFNFQLGTGYRIEKRKFNLEYEVGLDFNISFKAKGYTFNNDLQVINLRRNMKKNAVRPSLWTSLALDYPINKNISCVGTVYLKYRPGSVTEKTHEIKQRYFSPGISAGMKFLIF